MNPWSPSIFFPLFRDQLRATARYSDYFHAKPWTSTVTASCETACQSIGLHTNREYLRLDLAAYTVSTLGTYQWDLRIAFEAENGSDWEDEFVKLSHVVADTRVLLAYKNTRREDPANRLADYVTNHRERLARAPGCQWLFIFGPYPKDEVGCFTAYTLTDTFEILSFSDDHPLRLSDLQH